MTLLEIGPGVTDQGSAVTIEQGQCSTNSLYDGTSIFWYRFVAPQQGTYRFDGLLSVSSDGAFTPDVAVVKDDLSALTPVHSEQGDVAFILDAAEVVLISIGSVTGPGGGSGGRPTQNLILRINMVAAGVPGSTGVQSLVANPVDAQLVDGGPNSYIVGHPDRLLWDLDDNGSVGVTNDIFAPPSGPEAAYLTASLPGNSDTPDISSADDFTCEVATIFGYQDGSDAVSTGHVGYGVSGELKLSDGLSLYMGSSNDTHEWTLPSLLGPGYPNEDVSLYESDDSPATVEHLLDLFRNGADLKITPYAVPPPYPSSGGGVITPELNRIIINKLVFGLHWTGSGGGSFTLPELIPPNPENIDGTLQPPRIVFYGRY